MTMATPTLDLVYERLLTPTGLSENDVQQALAVLSEHAIDSGDLYFQNRRAESWSLEDRQVKTASHAIQQGVGVRAVCGEKTGFAYANELTVPALLEAARTVRTIARSGSEGRWQVPKSSVHAGLYPALDPIDSLSTAAKIQLLEQVDAMARRQDPRVSQVMVSLSSSQDTILIASSDGDLVGDIRPLVRLSVSVIVEQKGRREQGSSGGGGRFGYDGLLEDERALGYAREAVRLALINLDAVATPAGTMPVVLGSGWPGILLHEAIGHGLEGDFNRKGTSVFSGRIGERVASSLCTVVDDGTLPNRRGSLTIDDEGTPTQCTTLIEHGVLKGYLQDRLNARLLKTATTGNGRRESYAHIPLPRMTNTYLLPGRHEPAEIIASVQQGLYAVNFAGGQVDITSGKFVFSTSEAYLIENGRVTRPVKGATLIGNGPDVLTQVSMVGNDLKLDDGIGTCGKEGQSVPVGVGQPTLKVDRLTVGGTQA